MSRTFHIPNAAEGNSADVDFALATLTFYEPGSTTKRNIYTTDARTATHPNPISADAEGRWPTIYLLPLPYKVVLTRADNVEVWTADPVHGATGAVTISTTTPTLPAADFIWINPQTDRAYWYSDAEAAWININLAGDTVASGALNFPSGPANGDTFTSGALTWKYVSVLNAWDRIEVTSKTPLKQFVENQEATDEIIFNLPQDADVDMLEIHATLIPNASVAELFQVDVSFDNKATWTPANLSAVNQSMLTNANGDTGTFEGASVIPLQYQGTGTQPATDTGFASALGCRILLAKPRDSASIGWYLMAEAAWSSKSGASTVGSSSRVLGRYQTAGSPTHVRLQPTVDANVVNMYGVLTRWNAGAFAPSVVAGPHFVLGHKISTGATSIEIKDFTASGYFVDIIVEVDGNTTANNGVEIKLSTDNGATYVSSGLHSHISEILNGSASNTWDASATDNNVDNIQLTGYADAGESLSNEAGNSGFFLLRLMNFAGPDPKYGHFRSVWQEGTTRGGALTDRTIGGYGEAYANITSAINAVKLELSDGSAFNGRMTVVDFRSPDTAAQWEVSEIATGAAVTTLEFEVGDGSTKVPFQEISAFVDNMSADETLILEISPDGGASWPTSGTWDYRKWVMEQSGGGTDHTGNTWYNKPPADAEPTAHYLNWKLFHPSEPSRGPSAQTESGYITSSLMRNAFSVQTIIDTTTNPITKGRIRLVGGGTFDATIVSTGIKFDEVDTSGSASLLKVENDGVLVASGVETLNFLGPTTTVKDANDATQVDITPAIAVEDSGTEIVAAATRLDFTGNITVVDAGSGEATINVPAETSRAVDDDDVEIVANATRWNFAGAGVVVTDGGGGVVDITIAGASGGFGDASSQTASASSALTFGSLASGKEYEWTLSDVLLTNTGDSLQVEVFVGGAWQTTASTYHNSYQGTTGTSSDFSGGSTITDAGQITLGASNGNANGDGINGVLHLRADPAGTTNYKVFGYEMHYRGASGVQYQMTGSFHYDGALTALTQIRFVPAGGTTIASGRITQRDRNLDGT